MTRWIATLLVAVYPTLTVACDEHPPPTRQYRVQDGLMVDRDGHVLMGRGLNVSGSAKTAPGHLVDVRPADVQNLLAGGVNVARLLTFWKAIAPERGTTDASYLAAYREQVQTLTGAGIYVVVDMHQDVWGVPFAPHGAPAWACPEELTEGYEPRNPWWLNYTSPQVQACFDHFWSTPDLQAEFRAAWQAVAAEVCDAPKVLGFDLLNEPYPGSALFEPDWDNEVLLPFYQSVMDAIEQVCPGRLYFLEPSASYVLGVGLPMQFPEAIRDRAVYAGHFYPTEVHEPGAEGYDGDIEALRHKLWSLFGPYLEDGVPVWVGEWGGITTNPGFAEYVVDVNRIFAEWNVSATLWDYYAGEGGFAYLDASGVRKPVFDSVFGSPSITRLPSPPRVTTDYGAGSVTATFDCVGSREVEVLLPADGCACSASPAAALTAPLQGSGFQRAGCAGDLHVTLTCTCDPGARGG